ncbi:tRNA dimethylallyltransferase [Candidatus Dependentiae bacterium Noda2021]|nr:tRNA dimethylallyltransferase [Candidatus Dependentiae bacterium Noda2021]
MIIIYGPTASGKTDFADQLAQYLPSEIINMDMGQCYQPLAIGTAKPEWKTKPVAHHGFDIITEPVNYTVAQYRSFIQQKIEEIIAKGKVPILVGGSGFYLKSLLFPPVELPSVEPTEQEYPEPEKRWDLLNAIDPERAAQLHPHDVYRVTRALDIWYQTGKKPSTLAPLFNPVQSFLLLNLTRDRLDLNSRINARTHLMIEQGWIQEVQSLMNTSWQSFLQDKKIIGYDDIITYLSSSHSSKSWLISEIQKKTRHYAKRQLVFAAGLEREVRKALLGSSCTSDWLTLNLTLQPFELYIKQVLNHPHLIMKSAKNECATKRA